MTVATVRTTGTNRASRLFGRDHGGDAQPGQAFDQQVDVFAERQVVDVGVQAQRGQAVDQQALGAHRAQGRGKRAVAAAEFAQQHGRAGLDQLDLALVDHALQVPVEAGGVAQQLGRIESKETMAPGSS